MTAGRARAVAARAAGLAASLGLALTVLVATSASWPPERWTLAVRGLGWIALGALLLSLAASPVSRLAGRITPKAAAIPFSALRRALGITAALAALAHALASTATLVAPAWLTLVTWPHLRAGVGALLILCALLATSFTNIQRALRIRLWKPLHRATYAAALLTALHVLSSPTAPRLTLLAPFAALLALRVVGGRS